MTTAYDVAQYMASKKQFSGEAQMHKLLYYVQAWSLAWDGEPMFDEAIEAWQMGPVVPSMRHIAPPPNPDVSLSDQERSNIDAVLDYYGHLWGKQLIDLTHQEAPWKEAWGDRAEDDCGSDLISHETMRRTYSAQSIAGQGPHRKVVRTGRKVADVSDVLLRSSIASKRWDRTLALLAQ